MNQILSFSEKELAEELSKEHETDPKNPERLLPVKNFRAVQTFIWLHEKLASDPEIMTDLPESFRTMLKQKFVIDCLKLLKILDSSDGSRKFIFATADAMKIESVLIPEEKRLTLCISTQTGCRMGCRFCRTGRIRNRRNLSTGEILSQVYMIARQSFPQKLTNIVLMGMGEPLDNFENVRKALFILTGRHGMNFSPGRITVSTSGIADRIVELGKNIPVNIAVSFISGDPVIAGRIMPITRRYPVAKIIDALKQYPLKKGRKITVEYIMLKGINDSVQDARNLLRIFAHVPAKINLIPVNPFQGLEFEPPDMNTMEKIQSYLLKKHMRATIRKSRGTDIGAACGQLGQGN
jgi:23S rRNA (adenine2503-C2)-methyltransferase